MSARLPAWFKQELPSQSVLSLMRLFSELKVHTVCIEAKCPNVSDCFQHNEATFLLSGDTCTRNCRFCAVSKQAGIKVSVDDDEPQRIAQAVRELGLKFVVLTSVTRDDLLDGGAGQFSRTIKLIRAIAPDIKIEALIPDFQGKLSSLKCVLDAKPDILAHNLETVERLYAELRPMADYDLSLEILKRAKELFLATLTKSSIMLGLGEKEQEVICAMQDLRKHGCDILTLGQYLAPSEKHYPVKEFISLEQFARYQQVGREMGFKALSCAPKVRSSYKAEVLLNELINV